MKTIHICYPNGKTKIMYASLGEDLREIANDYPECNVFWLGAPLDTLPSEYSVVRYIPE